MNKPNLSELGNGVLNLVDQYDSGHGVYYWARENSILLVHDVHSSVVFDLNKLGVISFTDGVKRESNQTPAPGNQVIYDWLSKHPEFTICGEIYFDPEGCKLIMNAVAYDGPDEIPQQLKIDFFKTFQPGKPFERSWEYLHVIFGEDPGYNIEHDEEFRMENNVL